ncbi:uncharacterized protein LOC110983154 [Acanthaster planci]|uniref:Uncharacterized protein LOC110983154 n=1 Tax=Acanthaster planci TaxID=133434 RepID=A0A8B7YYT1_ACAPL|nr:uncharacterized protein LOC110983154 [Acanthaster planci]
MKSQRMANRGRRMKQLDVIFAALLIQGHCITVAKSKLACHDVFLSGANQTLTISSDKWEANTPPSHFSHEHYCWNVTTLDHLQLRMLCQYDMCFGEFRLSLFTPEFDERSWCPPSTPSDTFSSRNALLVELMVMTFKPTPPCEIRSVPDTNELACGPSNINFTGEYLVNVTNRNNRFLYCVWRVSSNSLGEFITFDVLDINTTFTSFSAVLLGTGLDIHNGSSLVHSISEGHARGTSYYVPGSHIWMVLRSHPRDVQDGPPTLRILLRSINGTDEAGVFQCGAGQMLCELDLKCLPQHVVCNGKVDCSDFSDERLSCDFCGSSNISIQHGEPVTILADFEKRPTAFFAIYPGFSPSIPVNSTSFERVVANHTGEPWQFPECVWRLAGPEGVRIHVDVVEAEGHRLLLTIWDSLDPESRLLVIDSETGIAPLPRTVFSSGTEIWVTSQESKPSVSWRRLKIRFIVSAYYATECDDEQYTCPSGRGCLEDISYKCDGTRDCSASGDELGCGNCDPKEFLCSWRGECVSGYKLCDGKADCQDYSDELLCGFCGNETIHMQPSLTYFVEHHHVTTQCLWIIVAQTGYQIQARILDTAYCKITFGAGSRLHSGSQGEVGNRAVRTVDNMLSGSLGMNKASAFPRSLSVNASKMWISNECHQDPYKDTETETLNISARQYAPVKCSEKEFACLSGLACIDQVSVCDGMADCPEYSDEFGCGECLPTEFSCLSGECIASNKKCNGWQDCTDLSDEFDCDPCDESFRDLSSNSIAVITSPGWNEDYRYPNRAQCLWNLVADVGNRIVLTFLEFSLEEGYDYLYIGNGNGSIDYFIKVTGERFPRSVASRGNTMFVKFFSDEIITDEGFRLWVQQKAADEVSCEDEYLKCDREDHICVQNDTSEYGHLMCYQDICGPRSLYVWHYPVPLESPGYPSNYPWGIYCVWNITSSKSKSILVTILDFQTERSKDVVEVRGSTLHGGQGMVFELRGTSKVRTMVFNCSWALVYFASDKTVSFQGFRLQILANFSANNETSCPDSDLFDCGDGSCVSPNARCDGFQDCQVDGSDEIGCDKIQCSDFFQCANSNRCIHWHNVCDGEPDCPAADDETNSECGKRCPEGCDCDVVTDSVQCRHGWSQTTIADIVQRTQTLYLSGGNYSVLNRGMFKNLSNLKGLWLPQNNITVILNGTFDGLQNLTLLDISENSISTIGSFVFSELENLDALIARNIFFDEIQSEAFNGLAELRTLVLTRGVPLNPSKPVGIRKNALSGLKKLKDLYVDNYRLCCDFVASVNGFELENCKTTEAMPPLNLCGNLMQNKLLRVAMWVLGLSALIGNAVVIVWRCCQGKTNGGKKRYSFLVLNLAISDFMMGVYMLIIAGADVYFGEKYSSVPSEWRSSPVCKIAGVISVLSSEASVFFVTLISIDSFLSIVFPFSGVRFREKSATGLVLTIWIAALSLSIWPTILTRDDSNVYGLSDVCIGLPLLTKPESYIVQEADIRNPLGSYTVAVQIGQGSQPVWTYSIVLFLGVNMVCFLIVLCSYVAIFVKVKRTAKRVRKTAHRSREIKMAAKMALIVGTDFACWMPVIIIGILSQSGAVHIGPEAYAWFVVFVLPINSSLNPYIYTLITAASEYLQARAVREEKLKLINEMKTRSMETLPSTGLDTALS